MCLATIETTKKRSRSTQCLQTPYVFIDLEFPDGTHRQKNIYYCSNCGKAEGTSKTPDELFEEWRNKGIKITIL